MPELNKRKEPESVSPTSPLHPLLRSSETMDVQKKGLLNLGNTCFMNSALQCLVHTVPLTSYFLTGKWKDELNTTNPLGMGGQIPKAYAELVSSLWYNDSASIYAPRNFKFTIGERNPTFVGYGQQDSHELLQSLLDGLHEDLNRILKKEYIEDPEMKDMSEQEFAKLSWDVYRKRNDSVIVDLFQSQLKSRTVCQKCGHTSIKFDPYMYLQLPIPEPKTTDVFVYAYSLDRGEPAADLKPLKIKVTVPRHCPIDVLKVEVAKKMNWSPEAQAEPDRTLCVELFSNKIHRYLGKMETIGDIAPEDIICVIELARADYSFYLQASEGCNEMTLPALFSLPGPTQYSSCHFGFPMMITVPEEVGVQEPMEKEQLLHYVGTKLYREVVRSLRRFSSIPLFRKVGSNVTMAEVLRRRREGISPMIDGDSVSWNMDHPDWEPIPDLFVLVLQYSVGRYNFQKNEMQVYPVPLNARETTPEVQAKDTDDSQLPSPKSDLSDLANDLNQGSLDDSQRVPEQPAGKPTFTVFNFRKDHEFVMNWDREVATLVFGKRSIPETLSTQPPNSVFNPVESPEVKVAAIQPRQVKTISLAECMTEFTKEELLDGNDTMYCSACKEHQPTKKQLHVYGTPEILVIHLKRFSSSGRHTYRSKLEDFVDAPLEGLDISNLIAGPNDGNQVYDLFAVSNHFGGLGGGHYTAYVKDPNNGRWYDCDDSRISPLDSNVMTKAAYLLFYRRRNHPPDHFRQILSEANNARAKELEERKQEQALARPVYAPPPPPPYTQSPGLPSTTVESWGTIGDPQSAQATANNSRVPSEIDKDEDWGMIENDDLNKDQDWGIIPKPDESTWD